VIRVRSPHSGISGVLLVLALAGLLVMHGFDAGVVAQGSGGEAAMSPAARHGMEPGSGAGEPTMAMGGSVGSEQSAFRGAGHRGEAAADGHAGHVGWGHVVAVCVAVLATFAAGAVRRLLASVRARIAGGRAPVAGRLVRLLKVFRPPGPARVELCVLTC